MAATGTPTPNIGLRIPIGTDPASVDDINYNSNLLDTKLGAVGSDSVQDQLDTLNGKIGNLPKMVYGETSAKSCPANSWTDFDITFPTGSFSQVPILTCNAHIAASPYTEITGVNIKTISSTDATVRIYNSYSSALSVRIMWIAVL